jgi:hypothetical protein
MGDERGLWKQHREEVAREIRARRRPARSGETGDNPGRLATFWRELGLDAERLAGVFGRSPALARKRKGVT